MIGWKGFLFCLLVVCFSKKIFLSPKGVDQKDCGSKLEPCRTIRKALSFHGNSHLVLMDGIYEGEENTRVELGDNIQIESDSKDATKVILDGNLEVSLIQLSSCVLFNVSYITVKRFDSKDNYNAGFNLNKCKDVYFNNVIFQQNMKGAIKSYNTENIQVNGCKFDGNYASEGAAIYLYESKGVVMNSIFEKNTHFNYGTIYLDGSEFLVNNCSFNSNRAINGAGIYTKTSRLNVKKIIIH